MDSASPSQSPRDSAGSPTLIAVDWGTSNRRAYRLDAEGRVEAEMEDECGITSVEPGGFPQAVEAIVAALGDHPMLLAGMIGSNRGWCEAPYVPCPAALPQVAARLQPTDRDGAAIVPGLSTVEARPGGARRGDVMRGEEVQIFGLMASEPEPALTVCHPGTHTKWATTQGDRIGGFRTAMTGEMFALLSEHSLLAPLMKESETEPVGAFLDGVDAGLAGGALTADLFSIRAGVLLSLMEPGDAASYASGLLIGADVREGLAWSSGAESDGGEVVVLGRPSLTRLYAAAIERAGRRTKERDGAEAFVAGMQAIRAALAR